MTNETQDLGFVKYEGAYVAMQYARDGDLTRAGLALETVPLDDDGKTLMGSQYFAADQGKREASMLFGSKFDEGLGKSTFTQLKDFYDAALSTLSDDARTEAETLFDTHAKKKYGDVQTAYLDAVKIMEDENSKAKYKRGLASGGLKGEQLEEAYKKGLKAAKRDVERYGTIMQTSQLLQEKREESIRSDIRTSLLEKILSGNGE